MCVCVCLPVPVNLYMYMCVCVSVYLYMYVCMYVCLPVSVNLYMYMCVCVCLPIPVNLCVSMCIYIYVCVFVCLCIIVYSISQFLTLKSLKNAVVDSCPQSFDECIKWARTLYQEYYHNQIAQLLHVFPHDHTTTTGQPFWSGPKRCPRTIPFNPDEVN